MIWYKPASLRLYLPNYIKPFIGFSLLWISISLISHKYHHIIFETFSKKITSLMKTNFVITAFITFLIFFFNRFSYSRSIVFGTIVLATFFEIALSFITEYTHKMNRVLENAESNYWPLRAIKIIDSEEESKNFNFSFPVVDNVQDSINLILKNKFLKNNSDTFKFIADNVDLKKIHKSHSSILNSHTLFNIENIEESSQCFFLNLHKLNDFRRINQYFIQVNENLQHGGYFISCGETINERFRRIFTNYPIILSHIIFSFDFVVKRIFPKLPFFKAIYFAITKGENRAISKAEILGRLYFCGFRVISTKEINDKLYFIAQKINKPKDDILPSYGPLIKMKRVGKDKKFIYIYKFRTMHPYSEYLQQYIFDNYKLEDKGKFKNDFRITGWGKVFRKLWIDELPQFINFLRGELSLVGIRALSLHYFSLYPEDLQNLRTKYKPGLIPPFYVDIPNSFEEILESERRYLLKKIKKGYIVNIEYFFRAWWNIIFKHARSQ